MKKVYVGDYLTLPFSTGEGRPGPKAGKVTYISPNGWFQVRFKAGNRHVYECYHFKGGKP